MHAQLLLEEARHLLGHGVEEPLEEALVPACLWFVDGVVMYGLMRGVGYMYCVMLLHVLV